MEEKNKTTEEKVLAAAMKEFAAHGFAGARVDTIAEKAKVNKAMIYYHYKSKEELYEKILTDIADRIYRQIREAAVGEGDPVEVFYAIVSKYMYILNSFEREVFQILLRELASGASHFRKIAIPNLIIPVYSIIEPLIRNAVKEGRMREVNTYYTFMQIIGGIIFFNVIRIPLEGSELEKLIFRDDYLEEFKANMFKILKNGLELNGENL
jgi:AcrR family transcriptional regulator